MVSITGSAATGRGTYAISSLSAFVNVSCEGPVATVVCSGEAPSFGVGIRAPALIATIAPRPIEQGIASHTVLITSTPRMAKYANDCKPRTESGAEVAAGAGTS